MRSLRSGVGLLRGRSSRMVSSCRTSQHRALALPVLNVKRPDDDDDEGVSEIACGGGRAGWVSCLSALC